MQHTDTRRAPDLGRSSASSRTSRRSGTLSRGLIGVANVILPGRGIKEGPFVTEEEIRQMADVAADEEVIEREERRLIHSIFEFGDTVVREVMMPRPDMVAIEADATVEEAIERRHRGRVLAHPRLRGHHRQHHRARVPEGPRAPRPFGRGRVAGAHRGARGGVRARAEARRRAAARDAEGAVPHGDRRSTSTAAPPGLVTLEDLLEEIVGEITDEYDVEEPGVEHLPDGALRVPGSTPIDDVSEELGVELPDTEWDTVGGLVFNLLGHVPEEGETVRFQGLEFRTERVQGRRIVEVQIRPSRATTTPSTMPASTRPPSP